MTIPFYCLIVTMIFPLICKVPVAIAMSKLGGYDNNNPRDQQTKLTGWGKRAHAAHLNSFEIMPVFASAVFIAHLAGADPTWSARLAVIFVVSRFLYLGLYLADVAVVRSMVWGIGLFSSLGLALLKWFV